DPLSARAREFAATVLEDDHRKARRLGRKVGTLDPANLHRLRIRVKKLRYATEFFGSLWPDRWTKKYLSGLKDLQQALGTYHDITVATDLVASLGARGQNAIKPGIDRIGDWLSHEQQRQRKEVVAMWKRFRKQKLFWKATTFCRRRRRRC